MRTALITAVFALWAATGVAQQIYKTVDEDGKVTYSDKPPADEQQRKEAELPPLNAVPETGTARPQPSRSRSRNQEQNAIRYAVHILNPSPEASIPPGQRDLNIVVGLDQDLREDHFLAFYLNDELLRETRERQLVVQEIFRGTHEIQVEVLGPDGQVLGASEPVTIYVHRPSILNRPGS